MSEQRVSIQVLNANRVGELAVFLSSLLSQSYKEWDLVLLDESNGPSINQKYIKDLLARMKCEGHGVIYKHQNPPTHNIGKNRNTCFEMDEFKNELIIRIDDDSYCDVDYVQFLVSTYNFLQQKGLNVGAVGGLVPPLGNPIFVKKRPKIFNEILMDGEGNILNMADDGGYCYKTEEYFDVIPSHHLRSSFLFTRTAHEKVGGHPLEYGFNGFREETDFTLKLAFAGYKLFTNLNALCWHLQSNGGSRQRSSEEYNQLCMINDKHFRDKVKYWVSTKTNPFIVESTNKGYCAKNIVTDVVEDDGMVKIKGNATKEEIKEAVKKEEEKKKEDIKETKEDVQIKE